MVLLGRTQKRVRLFSIFHLLDAVYGSAQAGSVLKQATPLAALAQAGFRKPRRFDAGNQLAQSGLRPR